MISWSFVLLFITDLLFVTLTRFFPQEYFTRGFGRRIFDFSFDLFGFTLLLGTIIAIIEIYRVRKSETIIYHDPFAVLLVLLTTFGGFLLEAVRLAPGQLLDYSFFGSLISLPLGALHPPLSLLYDAIWLLHVGSAGVLIAYIPNSRLIHIIATPTGSLLDSQSKAWDEKIRSTAGGLMSPATSLIIVEAEVEGERTRLRRALTLIFYILFQVALLLASTTYFLITSLDFILTLSSGTVMVLAFAFYMIVVKRR